MKIAANRTQQLRLQNLVLSATLGLMITILPLGPAKADDGRDRGQPGHDERGHDGHWRGDRGGGDHEDRGWGNHEDRVRRYRQRPDYYEPHVVYAPPLVYAPPEYYAPPPIYRQPVYEPPGINLIIPFDIR